MKLSYQDALRKAAETLYPGKNYLQENLLLRGASVDREKKLSFAEQKYLDFYLRYDENGY